MADQNNRSNFIFGLTLTELAFILFFILVFISLSVIDEKETKNVKLAEDIVAYKKAFETIPEFKNKSVSEKTKWLKELVEKSNLRIKNQELIKENKALKDSYEKIVETIPGLKDKTESEQKKWLKELVEKSGLAAKNQALNKELTAKEEKLAQIEKELEHKMEQVASLQKKVILLGGADKPACWRNNKTKKIEYIYNIFLTENGIKTNKGYKEYRAKEFSQIPGSKNIVGKELSTEQFLKKTKSVLDWSKNRKPECRHYVRVFDQTKFKQAYKGQLKAIEVSFYKKEYRMTYSEFKKILASPSNSIIRDTKKKTGISSSKRSSQ